MDDNGYLVGIAKMLYHNAMARPQIKARHQFKHGAVASLFLSRDGKFELRIARQGEVPNGDKLTAWDRECQTFCNAFRVPSGTVGVDLTYGAFYYRLFVWDFAGNPFERVGGQHAAHLL